MAAKQKSDPVIDEDIRRRISAAHDHDPKRLVEHYKKLQQQYQERMIDTKKEAADKLHAS